MRASLKRVVAALRSHYGAPRDPVTRDPFEIVVWENVAYLVDDERRAKAYRAVREAFGLEPASLAGAPIDRLTRLIEGAGMHPRQRAEKLHKAAATALAIGPAALREAVARDPARAHRLLKRFPGIGDPGADKILLLARSRRCLAPESNGLRVLTRLGIGHEGASYAVTYRLSSEAVESELPRDPDSILRAHQLLRRHGQELCKSSKPKCPACPLRGMCAYAGAAASVRETAQRA